MSCCRMTSCMGVFKQYWTWQGNHGAQTAQQGTQYKLPVIMQSMQNAPLAQALGPGSPGAPAHKHVGNEWVPTLKGSNARAFEKLHH